MVYIEIASSFDDSFLAMTMIYEFITFNKTHGVVEKGGVVVVVVVMWIGVSRMFGTGTQQAQYQTATVELGSVISTVTESGNVSTDSQTNVTSPTDGIITNAFVKNGDTVAAGDKLFSVKSTATPQAKASAYASFLGAQNTLNAAKAKMNSLQSALFKANQAFVNDKGTQNPDTADPKYIEENADWQQAESDYTNQSGVIAQAEAALTSASLALQATQDSTVTAPTDGRVANLSAIPGTAVTASTPSTSSSNTTSSGTTVLVLGNFSILSIKAAVSEVDVAKVKGGQKATITLDVFTNKTYAGTVTSVDTIGTNTSGVVSYNAYIRFIDPPATIQPAMTASAVIQIDRKDDVLKVPLLAVQTTNGESVVRIMKNGVVTPVPVEVGLSSDSEIEIVSGLKEGDTVITGETNPSTSSGSSTASPFGGTGFGGRGFGGGGQRVFINR